MRLRPDIHVLFWLLEAVLIGAHYAFPAMPYYIGNGMFWAGIIGLIIWVLFWMGAFDRVQFVQKLMAKPKVERDVEAGEAIAYVEFREWGHPFFEGLSRKANIVAAKDAFRQAAVDGEITIWGKRSGHSPHEIIAPEFWLRHQIDWFGLLRGGDEVKTEPTASASDTGDRYLAPMTSKAQIEAKWPPKRSRFVLRLPWERRINA